MKSLRYVYLWFHDKERNCIISRELSKRCKKQQLDVCSFFLRKKMNTNRQLYMLFRHQILWIWCLLLNFKLISCRNSHFFEIVSLILKESKILVLSLLISRHLAKCLMLTQAQSFVLVMHQRCISLSYCCLYLCLTKQVLCTQSKC